MEKVNAKKMDLAIIMTRNLYLTAQNIVVAFHINRGVPEGRRSEEREIISTCLLFKDN